MKRKKFPAASRANGITPAPSQRGATLIEVLVSMLMLGLGVLVLLATQIRTVAGVREAENQTIVAQATQNLIEGMLLNPTLNKATLRDPGNSTREVIWNRKNYDVYASSIDDEEIVSAGCNNGLAAASGVSKAGLALSQICDFRQALADNLPDANIHVHICRDGSGGEPSVSGGAVNWNCDSAAPAGQSAAPYVVKVLWQMDTDSAQAASGAVAVVDGKAVYTYQARVTE